MKNGKPAKTAAPQNAGSSPKSQGPGEPAKAAKGKGAKTAKSQGGHGHDEGPSPAGHALIDEVLPGLDPLAPGTGDLPVLDTIAELVRSRRRAEEALRVAVSAARDDGYTWAEIAAVLGMSKQDAQRTYGPKGSA